MNKGLLIYNQAAGSLDEGLVPRLISALGDVDATPIQELGDLSDLPARARSLGISWIAVAGGDGTVESVAAALIGQGIPLGVITAGTYNNFARSLDLPLDPIEACRVIRNEQPSPIDAGFANGKPFFECAGIGLDAALFPFGEQIKSGNFARWFTMLRRAYFYKPRRFTLTLDRPLRQALQRGAPHENHRFAKKLTHSERWNLTTSALMISVSNGPLFGMNFAIAPDARMDDGLLTISIFRRYNKLELWWHFLSIAQGRRAYSPKTITLRVAKMSISAQRPAHVHLDGSPAKIWPLEVECRPAALEVFRPPKA
ncbi:YegS/Rv2252/BmrU family lipid kinase [soil metagenome]